MKTDQIKQILESRNCEFLDIVNDPYTDGTRVWFNYPNKSTDCMLKTEFTEKELDARLKETTEAFK